MTLKIGGRGILQITFVLLFATVLSAQDRGLLPKYGLLPKEQWQKEADDAFLKATDEEYHGDRKKASMDTSYRGWQYLQSGDPETAMRRFNQAWLLNEKNGTALWGMAAVESDSGKMDESLKLFAEAERYVGDDINFAVDYSRGIATAGMQSKNDALINDALDRFARIYKKAPQNARNLKNWAVTYFYLGKYSDAWAKVKLAEATPNKAELDPQFVKALEAKMPRPKN